jgi:fatty-acyl-CoA synthase
MNPSNVPLTPLSFLRRSADVWPDNVGVVSEAGESITYRELYNQASALADALRAAGVKPGDRVAVLAPNTVLLLAAHFGVPGAGGVLVALNTRLGPSEYEHIINHSRAKVLIVDSSLIGPLAPIRESLPGLELTVVARGEAADFPDALAYEPWIESAPAGPGLVSPDDEDAPITVNYTSGTTGEPKGVVYTHRGAYLNSLGTAISFDLGRSAVYLWTLPMFHCNGWCFTWAVTAVGGRHVCLLKVEPGTVLDLIATQKITHFCAAPVVLNTLLNHPSGTTVRFPQRVRVATGGAPPSPTTIARARAMGMDLTHLYGLTESYGPSLVCEPQLEWSTFDEAELARAMARQGVRTLTVEDVRVVDEAMVDVPADGETVGQIVFRSNSVMAGYLNDEVATSAAISNGWLLTGDLAVMHADGYIHVHDRAKDIIITGGENVSSVEVENVLMSVPGVAEAAVVARPDETWGEVPVAFVSLIPGASVTAEQLVEHVRTRLAHFKAPKDVVFTDLPKTSTGKIQKAVLRDIARSSE